MSSLITGRGLWYGNPHIFSLDEWNTCCKQAHTWGIQILHPKLADAANPNIFWYDGPTMEKLRDIAVNTYHLQVVPWMWTYGGTLIEREAQVAAALGNLFGSVILDIEDAWAGHDDWSQQFGHYLHQMGYTHDIYATVYANPEQHPTPISSLNDWVTGFLPQVYFAEWSPQTAANAISYFLPQWERLDAALRAQHQVLKPILPIISLERGVPTSEIANWLHVMQPYGYCGFWYDGVYAPYARTIEQSPLPAFAQAPTPPIKETSMATIDQNLAESDLKVLWHLFKDTITWKPLSAIMQLWTLLVQHHPEIPIGSPTEEEQNATIDTEPVVFITFTSGRRLVYFKKSGKTCII